MDAGLRIGPPSPSSSWSSGPACQLQLGDHEVWSGYAIITPWRADTDEDGDSLTSGVAVHDEQHVKGLSRAEAYREAIRNALKTKSPQRYTDLAKITVTIEGEKRTIPNTSIARAQPKYSPITINHWRTALGNLYRTLGGRACYTPVRDVPRLPEPDEVDRAIPMELVRRIIAQMKVNALSFGAKRESMSALRAEILSLTGMRVGELQNLVATDIRLDGSSPVVSIRTLKGGKNRRVPLNADAVAAFRAFRKADAFGPFSVSSLRKALHAACARVLDEHDKPTPPIHPHVLRHSFASWLVNDGGVPLKTAQKMLGHRNIKTTARYVREDEERARLALQRLESVKSVG